MSLQLYSEFAVDSMMQQRENEFFFNIYHYQNTTCKDQRQMRLKRIYNNMQLTQEVVRLGLWRMGRHRHRTGSRGAFNL